MGSEDVTTGVLGTVENHQECFLRPWQPSLQTHTHSLTDTYSMPTRTGGEESYLPAEPLYLARVC